MSTMKRNADVDHALLATCLDMAKRGLSVKVIAERTGLSGGQVYYRLKQFDTKLWDYRNGKTPEAIQIIERTDCAKYNIRAVQGETYDVARFRPSVAS